MASVTVALKDNEEGEWYSFLLSPEEETRLSQDPSFVSYLLNSVKKNKVTVLSPSTTSTPGEISLHQSDDLPDPKSPEDLDSTVSNDEEDLPPEEEENDFHCEDVMGPEPNNHSEVDLEGNHAPQPISSQISLRVGSQKKETLLAPKPSTVSLDNIATVAVDEQTEHGDLFEHRFVWTYPSVRDLIAIVRQKQHKFANPMIKRKNIWREIGKSMFEKGYPITSEFCERKWRNLRGTYKAILFKCQKNPHANKNWEFFKEMHDIYKDDPNMNPTANTEDPTPTTIRVVSAGGATYHIIEQATPRSILTANRKKNMPRIQNVTSLRPSKASPTVSVISSGQSVLLSAGTAKTMGVVTAASTANTDMDTAESSHLLPTRRRKTAAASSTSGADSEPDWFLTFKKEMRETNERNLQEIRAMHDENIRVLQERNAVMKGFLQMLSTSMKDTISANEEVQS